MEDKLLNSFKLFLQCILPKLLITRIIGWIANKRIDSITKIAIDMFIKYYNVNMKEAQKQDTASYPTFNDFFVRQLRDGVRPINTDKNILVMPADGIISQFGKIKEDKILQAKNHNYSLEALLAGNYVMADNFINGNFVTIYLTPKDYHRVHMPCNGTLREMIYVPGSLFSVNFIATQNISNIFARNERIICLFDTEFGPLAQIMIGATIVGSIETVWSGTITPPREGIIKRWTWPSDKEEGSINLIKGQEMGRFKLGSTVINLFALNKVSLVDNLEIMSIARIGMPMAIATNDLSRSNLNIDKDSSFEKKSLN